MTLISFLYNQYLNEILLAFAISFLLSVLFISVIPKITNLGIDSFNGIQKIHQINSLRLGGSVIFFSFFFTLYINFNNGKTIILLLSISPIFLLGIIEDLTLSVSAKSRLYASFLTSTMLVFFTDTKVDDLDILWANKILLIPMFGFMFTVVGLTATSNAFNFLDGLNGLASGVALVALAIFIYYCFSNEKTDLMIICIILFSSIIGFWFVNICTGKLFLGDSGAYLIGVLIAWIGVNLTLENSNISSWAIFFYISGHRIDLHVLEDFT